MIPRRKQDTSIDLDGSDFLQVRREVLFEEQGQHTHARAQDENVNLFVQLCVFQLRAEFLSDETKPSETSLVALVCQRVAIKDDLLFVLLGSEDALCYHVRQQALRLRISVDKRQFTLDLSWLARKDHLTKHLRLFRLVSTRLNKVFNYDLRVFEDDLSQMYDTAA